MTFTQFYHEMYLPRHADPVCRWLHALGVPIAVVYGCVVAWLEQWWLLVLLPAPGYLLGWIGHLVAHNRPTFFEHPILSFLGYWKMLADMLTGGPRQKNE